MSLSLRTIVLTACDYYGMSPTVLLAERRTRLFVRPRQVIMWLCRQHTGRSLPAIGTALGGRDHTTVLHGCRKIEELRKKNPEVAEQIADIEKLLRKAEKEPPEDASLVAARLEANPIDATMISPEAVLKMANVISERDRRLQEVRGQVQAMQEHLGAALAAAEKMAAEHAAKEAMWTERLRVEKRRFQVVPAHIIDRDLVT